MHSLLKMTDFVVVLLCSFCLVNELRRLSCEDLLRLHSGQLLLYWWYRKPHFDCLLSRCITEKS